MEKKRLSALAAFRKRVAEMEAQGMPAGNEKHQCTCRCLYADLGGSGTFTNAAANNKRGLESPEFPTESIE